MDSNTKRSTAPDSAALALPELGVRGLDREALKLSFLRWLVYAVGRSPRDATGRDWFVSVALAVRDRVLDRWRESHAARESSDEKHVCYLSLEFLMGRLLTSSMSNIGVMDACREALAEIGVDLNAVVEVEPDAALGNGGLGRLAACFLDSMASLGVPGTGYGIRYEYGLFRQSFERGWQAEEPEDWLEQGNPWEFERSEIAYPIDFYGYVQQTEDETGQKRYQWLGGRRVMAAAYDTPVVGWGGVSVNGLRLWSARPTKDFDLEHFNRGDYLGAVQERADAETLSRVLYPNDETAQGQELRLRQEYFFTSASLQDILRRFLARNEGWERLPDRFAIQLNDTHPAIAVPELMRLLMDVHGLPWEQAWKLVTATINYTNHTLLPEALERWPVHLMERVLPRHMQIIYEINAGFLGSLPARAAADNALLARVSLIDETGGRLVRMGNLAFLGSRKVNGVSQLHTALMKTTVFGDLHRLFPERIVNKTNGVTPRRWLHQCNPPLSRLITETIGDGWISDLERLSALEGHVEDRSFRDAFRAVKRANKNALAAHIRRVAGVTVDPDALFDVHVKRIHEYKRQLLNILHAIALYNDIRDHPTATRQPVVKIFAGKAAPSYWMAKLIIKLANDVARTVNQDPAARDLLKIVFLPNYNVTLAERIIPAADLSEQISTAGKEASGTGNMKFALNGALTIGTLDGANVEIRDRVGKDNIFIFGITAQEAAALQRSDEFDPEALIAAEGRLKRAVEMIAAGLFSPDDPSRFRPLMEDLRHRDPYLVTADFPSYVDCHAGVAEAFRQPDAWTRCAALNTARMGWFSSDRTIRDYAQEIWNVAPVDRATG